MAIRVNSMAISDIFMALHAKAEDDCHCAQYDKWCDTRGQAKVCFRLVGHSGYTMYAGRYLLKGGSCKNAMLAFSTEPFSSMWL